MWRNLWGIIQLAGIFVLLVLCIIEGALRGDLNAPCDTEWE